MSSRASYIQGVALDLAAMLKGKNQDYASGDEFSNFIDAAAFAGTSSETVMKAQMAIKWTRLENLMHGQQAVNESIEDNLMDLAGYAIILAAYYRAIGAMDESVKDGEEKGYL